MKRTLIDLLLLLTCIAIILLAFLSLLSMESAEQEAEVAATELTPPPGADVVALALPEPTAVPKPTPTAEAVPDKPTYNPAVPLSDDLQLILWAACEEHGVELAIALGLIEVESGFDPGADNGLCCGLMQLNRKYFPSGLSSAENIQHGVEYLGQLLARYDTVEVALTAYNAGHDTGSRTYANAVLAAAERWRDVVWADASEATP